MAGPAPARKLFKDVAIYGVGDVATSIVNFLLIPLYTTILTPTDYGVLALLLTIEAGAKILLRWGVDAAFMRLYYDCHGRGQRQLLASTTAWFLLAVNGPVLAAGWLLAPWLSTRMFDTLEYVWTLRVFFLNTFLIGFFFLPFHVFRIEGRTVWFTTLTFARAAGTVLLRLIFIVGFHLGVFGIVAADLALTVGIGAALTPAFSSLLRPRFSKELLREALRFGVPRVPHGLAHQATALSDRWVLNAYVTLDRIGIYSMGVSLGLGMKLFLSAFEYAWAPFYLDAMRHPEAKAIYSRITTHVVAILALLATGLAAVATEVVQLMTAAAFHDAAPIVPWIALGVALQGFYQLTAIGLNITKRTALLPLATGAATAVAIGVNLLLVPRYGITGAAWTYALSYGALAVAGFSLSQWVYPVRYDWRRLGTIVASAIASYLLARAAIPGDWPVLARLIARGGAVCLTYPLLLAATGVFRLSEIRGLAALRAGLKTRAASAPAGEELELAGEIVTTPSIVEAGLPPASRESAEDRKVE